MGVKTKLATRRVIDGEALYQDVGERMKRAREKAGLTQQQLANALGMSRANVANLESGRYRVLLDHVYNAALLFGVEPRTLLP